MGVEISLRPGQCPRQVTTQPLVGGHLVALPAGQCPGLRFAQTGIEQQRQPEEGENGQGAVPPFGKGGVGCLVNGQIMVEKRPPIRAFLMGKRWCESFIPLSKTCQAWQGSWATFPQHEGDLYRRQAVESGGRSEQRGGRWRSGVVKGRQRTFPHLPQRQQGSPRLLNRSCPVSVSLFRKDSRNNPG